MREAMNTLAAHPDTIFIGQAMAYKGTAITSTLSEVPRKRIIEFPVAEETQLGVSIGLALGGYIPVSIFPRWNFLLLATNMLVNHLDKYPVISNYHPKVIIRVGVGAEKPMHPGEQHVGDFSDVFRRMYSTIVFDYIDKPEDAVPMYENALRTPYSHVITERSELYN